ncbi:MAG: radical SAM protein [Pseudomonadota bacterium]
MYTHIFGPVPSRRLGMSLGVDLVYHKVCSLDCIYCECGKTTRLTLERKEYVPIESVLGELKDYFSRHPDPDYITFSGSGEPTLSNGIGDVIRFIKQAKPGVKVAVLTNGTLLHQSQVRQELLLADVVIPSLDSALISSFKTVNRPAKGLDLETYIQGIQDFRNEYMGRLLLEVFILPGVNDSSLDLDALACAVDRIRPDSVQLNTLDRPGTEPGIRAATRENLENIARIFGNRPVEIIASGPARKPGPAFRNDMESAILETIHRRPCTARDLASVLGIHTREIDKCLDLLDRAGKIQVTRLPRGIFYATKKPAED